MNKPWFPIVGAVLLGVGASVLMQRFGTGAGIIAVGVMAVSWWATHKWKERVMDRLHEHLKTLDEIKREEIYGNLDPEIRKDIRKRIEKEKSSPTSR